MKTHQLALCFLLLSTRFAAAQNDGKWGAQHPVRNSAAFLPATRNRALKITPFAFLIGYTAYSFEKSRKPGRSLELKLGIVGLGIPRYPGAGQLGATATVGRKFINQPYSTAGHNRDRPLAGWYFRPDLTVACYKQKYTNRLYGPNAVKPVLKPGSFLVSYASFVPTFGFQAVRSWGLVTDFFAGAGIAVIDPINGNRVVDYGKFGNLIPLDKKKGGGAGVSYALKLGFLMGGNF